MSRQIITGRSGILKQAQAQRKRRYRLKLIFRLTLLLVFVGEILWLAHWDKFLLQEVRISGASPTKAEKIENLSAEILAGSYFGLLPRKNIFFYPRETIISTLSQSLPDLKEIKVSQKDNLLSISVSEREAKYFWCDGGGDNCFFLDEHGLAFASAPEFLGRPLFVIEGALPITPIGGRPLAETDFKKLIDLKTGLAEALAESVLGLGIERVALGLDGELKFFLSNNAVVFLNLNSDPEKLFADFKVALGTEVFVKEYRKNLESGRRLDYLDARFADKVFYKFLES
ncbi:hypothetical protein IT398_00035 [Candidatus Nomurabacteria bacterium]|nr:hypothetical protein [Candidatus Nomurabacteria bacterium]